MSNDLQQASLSCVTPEREPIFSQLVDLIPEISRRECTVRVMQPVDYLLDQLIELSRVETLQGNVNKEAI